MIKYLLVLLLTLSPVAAIAENSARSEERAALFEALKAAESPQVARAATTAIWELWMTAPDEDAQQLMDFGMARMRVYDNEAALEVFNELIEYAPDFAEAWNQRAFAKFRMDDFAGSLEDIQEVLEREPNHFGALSGRFRILMQQGRRELAVGTLESLVDIYPLTPERALLPRSQRDE